MSEVNSDTDMILVPRSLLGALGHIVRNSEHGASQTADRLRIYAMSNGIPTSAALTAHADGLRAFATWMLENDIDMKCPDSVQDPVETAHLMEQMAGMIANTVNEPVDCDAEGHEWVRKAYGMPESDELLDAPRFTRWNMAAAYQAGADAHLATTQGAR